MSAAISAQVLACPLDDLNDAGASTVGDYLVRLLAAVWAEGEGFSGKRPFGNSGWHWDLYEPLARAGLVSGSFDADDYLDEVDRRRADRLIADAIASLWTPS